MAVGSQPDVPMNTAGKHIVRKALLLLPLCGSGFIVAAAVVGYGEYSRTNWVPAGRWIGFALYTALAFGIAALEFRNNWSQFAFWLTLGPS
jgi:hypothetical protein